jgi:hypothetical protein
MAGGDRSGRDAPEPLARLLARSEAVERELERARDRLADLAERFDADEPLTETSGSEGPPTEPRPANDHPSADEPAADEPPAEERTVDRVFVVPEPTEPQEPSRDHDITVLQEAARRRLSDER